jgi:hypothetical protein
MMSKAITHLITSWGYMITCVPPVSVTMCMSYRQNHQDANTTCSKKISVDKRGSHDATSITISSLLTGHPTPTPHWPSHPPTHWPSCPQSDWTSCPQSDHTAIVELCTAWRQTRWPPVCPPCAFAPFAAAGRENPARASRSHCRS